MVDIGKISTGLIMGEDGIWYSSKRQDISFPSCYYDPCLVIEDNSFWFEHRNNCIVSVVKLYPPENGGTIFDIGGGNGFVSLALIHAGFDIALVEPGRIGALNAKKRGLNKVICASIDTAKFKQHSLPAVGLFDVIEHIEDDLSFLKSIQNCINRGGVPLCNRPFVFFSVVER